ncbi:MAG TPA: AarF/ABC1/UbiB kinase family protein [Streptosporangiaceae bacterium]|nr:AarF/ABC1/UbiB kinase family protein [Streptosporangiaceae bacterium]
MRRAGQLRRARRVAVGLSAGAAMTALSVALVRRRVGSLRFTRGLAAAQLVLRGGARYASSAPRLFAAAGEHRERLRNDLALQTAQDVTATLGAMKGVLVKLGQMASYVDDGLAPPVRRTLSRLQDSIPPMSPELAAQVVLEELGLPPEQAFAQWDPEPIAAASIGQVHRAMTHDGRAVAVKVQYPGIAETMAADLDNVALLRRMLKITAPNQDVDALVDELRERVLEELDYRQEAANQRLLAAYYDGHPTIHVPAVIDELSTRRVVTSELSDGARFAELATWSQEERDLAGETIYRFVFRSLYEVHAFNGDPHPGNYLFHGQGRVTFLDFGLVKHFTADDLQPLMQMARRLCVDQDPEAFRASLEEAGFLAPGAPLSTDAIVEHLAVFYELIRESRTLSVTGDYASAVVRRFFDVRSPVAQYASVPRSYVILQRINLGLFALLGDLRATANWRAIAEEIWPFLQAPPSTPMGEAELRWRESRKLAASWRPSATAVS